MIGLPPQPTRTPWPTERWPRGDLVCANAARLGRLFDEAWGPQRRAELGQTHALLLIQDGQLVFDHYGDGFAADQTHASWSMAKSVTQALVGILVRDGKLDIHAPARVREWPAGDPRAAITLDQLLRMSSGLAFVEDYVGGGPVKSDILEMLYGSGKADLAHYAASLPLAHPPGSHWRYSTGTTNIISRRSAEAIGAKGEAFHAFMNQALFDPLGMQSPVPKFDAAGTFNGGSYCFCTAEDFARFGLLYLRDGVWDGRRILPEGWVDYARTPTPQSPGGVAPYGAQWWLDFGGPGSFSANGFEGQFTLVVPDLDMVIVRLGKTPAVDDHALWTWMRAVTDCFRTAP